MKIGILGIRGLPLEDVSFGGFEAFISGLAPRLAERGHEVTVYCRRDLYTRRPTSHPGVRLQYVPSIEQKALGTPLHTLLCACHATLCAYDAILVLNSGNGLQCGILRLATRARLALNVDGVEWDRSKWGRLARAYFKLASYWGIRFVHMPIVDSRGIGDVYRSTFGRDTTFIPYATELYSSPEDEKVRAIGLNSGSYALVVGRLVPENCTDIVIQGFQRGLPGTGLVVVGGSNYQSSYHRHLRSIADGSVVFLGHVHDQALLWQLFRHSRVYLHGHSVGGTNPGLLQALAAGCCIGANGVTFNREVVGDAGMFFEPTANSVAEVAKRLWRLTPAARKSLSERAQKRIAEGAYTWDRVVTLYELALQGGRTS